MGEETLSKVLVYRSPSQPIGNFVTDMIQEIKDSLVNINIDSKDSRSLILGDLHLHGHYSSFCRVFSANSSFSKIYMNMKNK